MVEPSRSNSPPIAGTYVPRVLAMELQQQLAEFPVVTILGPRQAGKTTLARYELPAFSYVSLELPHIQQLAEDDPLAFLDQHPSPLIIDEIQRVPDLLRHIQSRVDEVGGVGRYVLTGSHQLALHGAVAQSLAGRTGMLTLMPFSVFELSQAGLAADDWCDVALQGFLPRVHCQPQRPVAAYGGYLRTYVERDVRQLIQLRDLTLFEKFLKLLAGRVGQLVEYSSLGNDVGVDAKTIRHWLSILEASFLVLKLPPYFENFGKRVVKTPKLYFADTGLLCYLLGLESADQVRRDPLVGQIYENLVVLECWKARLAQAREPELYFIRDRHGREIDLLHRRGRDLWGLEVKSAQTWSPVFRTQLDTFHKTVTPLAERLVVYNGQALSMSDGVRAVGITDLNHLFSPTA